MLWAETEPSGVVTFLKEFGVFIAIVLGAIGLLVERWYNTRPKARAADAETDEKKATAEDRRQAAADKRALTEWQHYADRIREDAENRDAELGAKIERLEAEVRQCHEERTQARIADAMKAVEIKGLQGQVALLEQAVAQVQRREGSGKAGLMPAIVTATPDGVIIEASPSIMPMLHYLSTELVGKNVEVLIPERLRAAHREKLRAVREDGFTRWSDRAIVGHALTREGSEVPVTVTLTGVQDEAGRWLITAEIVGRLARGGVGKHGPDGQ